MILFIKKNFIIGDSKSFIKMNKQRREIIHNKLKELSLFSEISNTFKEEQSNFENYSEEYNHFQKIY